MCPEPPLKAVSGEQGGRGRRPVKIRIPFSPDHAKERLRDVWTGLSLERALRWVGGRDTPPRGH